MLTDSSSESASMSLDFNCQEESKSNEIEVTVPRRGQEPLTLFFEKDCSVSSADKEFSLSDEAIEFLSASETSAKVHFYDKVA